MLMNFVTVSSPDLKLLAFRLGFSFGCKETVRG